MKLNQLITAFLLLILAGCTVNRDKVVPQGGSGTTGPGSGTVTTPTTPTVPGVPPEQQVRTVSGEWIAEKGGAGGLFSYANPFANTFRNFQYTLVVAKNNQKLDIALASPDIAIQFVLFDPLGQQIGMAGVTRTPTSSYTVNAGTYRLAICAERRAVGKFTLTVSGVNADPSIIPSQFIQSGTQNWGPMGGGGAQKTFKNHFYTFEVTEDNSTIDTDIISSETDVALVMYDSFGQQINDPMQGSPRNKYQLGLYKKGTYTAMAATFTRGGVGNYQLNIAGKVQNLARVESQVNSLSGRWTDRNSTDVYTIQTTATSAPLDIEINSPDMASFIELQTSAGGFVANAGSGVNRNVVLVKQDVAKNTYLIRVNPPRGSVGGPGSYTLTVNGQFTDFKKQ